MDDIELYQLVKLTNDTSQPNLNALSQRLKHVDAMALTLKFFGYELAKTLAEALPKHTGLSPYSFGLHSKASTQLDLESNWVAYWLSELKVPVVFHRKLWELAYVLQALWERDKIKPGLRGLGFGCGTEPLPSYFASHDVRITVTDLEPEASKGKGWTNTNQHTSTIDHVFHANLVNRERFDANVELQYVDMNAIPSELRDYDFCWSICSLEHLGSIQKGLDFIRNSLSTLKVGGVAVHTTEFNFANDNETVDNWPTVLFQKKHFQAIADLLIREGHTVAPFDFSIGNKPLDKFIDMPPWDVHMNEQLQAEWSGSAHIKVAIDGFPSTCFGMIITKGVGSSDPTLMRS